MHNHIVISLNDLVHLIKVIEGPTTVNYVKYSNFGSHDFSSLHVTYKMYPGIVRTRN